ncbi:tyrosine-type recombinase/integrase [Deinococcus cellulosilyticus]|uniref:Site-specific integrase n=1 Tax=Deinococcus cellulosilyticus (strain DSM 18568 / NBRC 106333 / KACC 11606 / 5516J-15) TaxID=1223518 RepID=A0A511N2V1_DEIC1|nr:site-specific integrase [Deinococcus cellulosilyticus]GEM47174.1 site-specific integrase [Deinococcus cellulosilyticus NBRC 106333 = KACC 11606]
MARKSKQPPSLPWGGEPRTRHDGRLEYRPWVQDPRTGEKVRLSICARTFDELLEKSRAKYLEYVKGGSLTTTQITFGEWLVYYAGHKSMEVRPTTQYCHQLFVRYAAPLHSTPLSKVSTQMLDHLYRELISAGYSLDTTAHARSFIGSALKLAVTYRHISFNPNTETTLPRMEGKRVAQVIPPEHLETIFSYLQETSSYYPIFYTILSLGLRFGEGLGLKWSDIDWQQETVSLERAVTAVNGKAWVTGLKTRSSRRTLALHPALVKLLKEHKQEQERKQQKDPGFNPDGWVFCSQYGTMLYPDNVRQRFKKAMRVSGITENYRIHDLRHSFASYLITVQGADPKTAADILGHSNPGITLRIYTHSAEAGRRKAVVKAADLVPKTEGKKAL